MTTIEEIQQAILSLPDSDYTQLRRWFFELDWERWDREFEEDVKAGRLDFLKEQVQEAKRNGTLGYL